MSEQNNLPTGLYDRLLDTELERKLAEINRDKFAASINEVPSAEIPRRVANVVSQWVERTLNDVKQEARSVFAIDLTSRMDRLVLSFVQD